MKFSLFAAGLLLTALQVDAQKYISDRSTIKFFSDAKLEDIEAENKHAVSIFNPTTAEIVFSVPIRQFQFEKQLMQEHFNEKYLESEKYPKATFQGKLVAFDASKELQQATAKGKMTIHGVSRDVEIKGTVQRVAQKYVMKSSFLVKLIDYKIEIPQLLWQNIAEQVEVTIEFEYKSQ